MRPNTLLESTVSLEFFFLSLGNFKSFRECLFPKEMISFSSGEIKIWLGHVRHISTLVECSLGNPGNGRENMGNVERGTSRNFLGTNFTASNSFSLLFSLLAAPFDSHP
jgi:hypothetical protein